MLKRWLLSILTLLIAMVVALLITLSTQSGTRWFLQTVVVKLAPGHLRFKQIDGRLLSHLRLSGVHFDNAAVSLTAQSVMLAWRPWYFLRWQGRIDTLQVEQLVVWLSAPDPLDEATPPEAKHDLQPLKWPVYWPTIDVRDVQFQDSTLHIDAQQTLHVAQVRMQAACDLYGVNGLLALDQVSQNLRTWVKRATLHWQGPWSHYHLDAAWQGAAPTQNLALVATGNATQLRITQVSGSLWPRQSELTSQLIWYPSIQLHAQAKSPDLDFSQWFPAWPSHLRVNFEADAALDSHSWQLKEARLKIHQWQGICRQLPVKAEGQLAWLQDQLRLDHWRLQSGSAFMKADGLLSTKFADFSWQLNVPALHDLLPLASGSIASNGALKIHGDKANIQWQAAVKQVQYQTFTMKHLQADVAFHTGQPSQFAIHVVGDGWRWASQQLTRLSLISQGDYQAHQITAQFTTPQWQGLAQLNGGFVGAEWRGAWQRWDIQAARQAAFRLKEPVALYVSQQRVGNATPLCLQQSRQFVCLQGHWQANNGWQVDLTSSPLSLTPWQFLLPEAWRMSGFVQTEIHLKGQATALPQGQVHIAAKGLALNYQHLKTALALPLGVFDLQATLQPFAATAKASLTGQLGQVEVNAHLPAWSQLTEDWREQTLSATLKGQFSAEPWRALASPSVEGLQGTLLVQAGINGRLGQPKVDLTATVKNAQARLMASNIWLKPIELEVKGDPREQLTVNGRVQSGPGSVVITGVLDQLLQNPRVQLQLKGQRFLASHLASYEVLASPDLQLVYQNPQLSLRGSVAIPEASLRFVDYQKSVVSLTSDVVYVDGDASVLDFVSDVQLTLGDKVSLQYGGLKGRLVGGINVHESPNRPTSGSGEIRLVDATYHAFGQMFTISQGIARFSGGAITNPWVNIQASRKLTNVVPVSETGSVVQSQQIVGINDDLLVGVRILGPLKTSQIKLFSMPAGLSQADILSYLLLGRPTSEATGSGAQMLMSAASMLNNGSGPILQLQQQLKSTLGLEVDVGATSQVSKENQSVTQNTSVILGKALSPRLFLNYSIGIVQPVNTLRLTYKISPRWSAQSETSSLGNGGDLFYTINRK